MFDLFHEISQTLSNNKSRTALTGIAVAWGIFMLIVLLGMSKGVQSNFRDFASSVDSRGLSVWGGWTTRPYKGYPEWRNIRLKDSDIGLLKKRQNGMVENVTARINISDTARISSDRDYISSGPTGIFARGMEDIDKFLYGRRLNGKDLEEQRRVIILESRNAEVLFGDASKALGQTVRCMGLAWTVIGVYKHDWRQESFIPYTTAMALRGGTGEVDEINVFLKEVRTTEDGNRADAAVRHTLAAVHDFDPDDDGAVYLWNRFTTTIDQMKMLSIVDLAVWVIGFMTLVSGIVGVSNIMFVSVRERTHEIGVRRAIGAKPRDIVRQIILEGIVITTLFGYIGIVLGTVVTEGIGYMLRNSEAGFVPSVDLGVAVRVTVVLIVAGALAALFPALKATKVKPVEALRDE